MLACLVVIVAMIGIAQAYVTYDRQAAYNYGQKYWNKVCSDGYFFEVSYPPTYVGPGMDIPCGLECGCDCAHFVSCCIGSEINETGGGLNVPSRTKAYGEPAVLRLRNWLVNSGNAIYKSSIDDLMKGDVLIYCTSSDVCYHSSLYNGDYTRAAHSNSQRAANWDIGAPITYYIHINTQPPTVTSCDASGTEKNQFCPKEKVYVKASGLEPITTYKIWIQDDPVGEGDTLVDGENPDTALTPKSVNTDANGNFAPQLIWSIPEDAPVTYHEYDIVIDKQGNGANTGKYNAASDGIDSASVVGFVAPVPELPTIVLISVGLLALAGYVGLRRRKNN